MDKSKLPRDLRPFVDDTGRLCQWPSRYKVQRMAVALLAQRFEPGSRYNEKELNFRIMDGHTFADWALIRRSLVDWGFMSRIADGSCYWLRDGAAQLIARELTVATPAETSADSIPDVHATPPGPASPAGPTPRSTHARSDTDRDA